MCISRIHTSPFKFYSGAYLSGARVSPQAVSMTLLKCWSQLLHSSFGTKRRRQQQLRHYRQPLPSSHRSSPCRRPGPWHRRRTCVLHAFAVMAWRWQGRRRQSPKTAAPWTHYCGSSVAVALHYFLLSLAWAWTAQRHAHWQHRWQCHSTTTTRFQ